MKMAFFLLPTRATGVMKSTAITKRFLLLLFLVGSIFFAADVVVFVESFAAINFDTTTTRVPGRSGCRRGRRPATGKLLPRVAAAAAAAKSAEKSSSTTLRMAKKPQRLDDNADGVVYVNDKCINCSACSMFAPQTFGRSQKYKATERGGAAFHTVHRQPATGTEILHARAALAACPVAAIRVETLAERRHRAGTEGGEEGRREAEEGWTGSDQNLVRQMGLKPESSGFSKPFPRPFLMEENGGGGAGAVPGVYWVGHHNDLSFGATPYLFKSRLGKDPKEDDEVWIMVDTPRFCQSSVEAVTSLTSPNGPEYLFLTHVDDTADHGKWVERFPNLKRVFHAGDLGPNNWLGDESLEDVEILLQEPPPSSRRPYSSSSPLVAYRLQDGSILPDDWQSIDASELPLVILHTPGHSPGSITLFRRPGAQGVDDVEECPGILFTGDTYSYRTSPEHSWDDGTLGCMTGFPRYGNRLDIQAETLPKLLELDWDVVAPGHGHPRDYRHRKDKRQVQADEMNVAIEELNASQRKRVPARLR